MNRNELRKLIIKELKKAVYEDALVDPKVDDDPNKLPDDVPAVAVATYY